MEHCLLFGSLKLVKQPYKNMKGLIGRLKKVMTSLIKIELLDELPKGKSLVFSRHTVLKT
jgi:hypothetical protein